MPRPTLSLPGRTIVEGNRKNSFFPHIALSTSLTMFHHEESFCMTETFEWRDEQLFEISII